MPRRLLLPLLAVLALLCAAAPAASAAPPSAGAPAARAAVDELDDEIVGEDEACDATLDEDAALDCEEDLFDEGDDVAELCEDEWSEDDEWSDEDDWSDEDEQLADEGDAELASTSVSDEEDDCWTEDDEALAPILTDLRVTVAGQGRRQRVGVAFRLDEAGTVRLTLERTGGASASAKRCTVASTSAKGKGGAKGRGAKGKAKGKGKTKGCARPVALRGSRVVAGRAGVNEAAIGRRWNGRALAPGGYRLTATPLGAEGESVATTFALSARKR